MRGFPVRKIRKRKDEMRTEQSQGHATMYIQRNIQTGQPVKTQIKQARHERSWRSLRTDLSNGCIPYHVPPMRNVIGPISASIGAAHVASIAVPNTSMTRYASPRPRIPKALFDNPILHVVGESAARTLRKQASENLAKKTSVNAVYNVTTIERNERDG